MLHTLGLTDIHRERNLRSILDASDDLTDFLLEVLYLVLHTFPTTLHPLPSSVQSTLTHLLTSLSPRPNFSFSSLTQRCSQLEESLKRSEAKVKELKQQQETAQSRNRRDTLVALMTAEGAVTEFSVTAENSALKAERDALKRELGELQRRQETEKNSENEELMGLGRVYDQQVQAMRSRIEGLETGGREKEMKYAEEKMQMMVVIGALEMQLAQCKGEIQQLRQDKDRVTAELTQTYQAKDEFVSKYIKSQDDFLTLRKQLASKSAQLSVAEHQLSHLTETRTTEEDSRTDDLFQTRLIRLQTRLSRKKDHISSLQLQNKELKSALQRERKLLLEVLLEANGTLNELCSLGSSPSM